VNLHVVGLEEWKVMSANAHKVCFTDEQSPDILTCSYALLVTDKNNDSPLGYATLVEMNKSCVYMQHGGSMPNIRGTIHVMAAYRLILEFLKKKYTRITTRIKNTNIPMLKIAIAQGLLVTGIDVVENETFLQLSWSVGG